jgi:hypothetical protein
MTTTSLLSARIGIAGVAALVLGFALPTYAADYPFTIRGIVDINSTNKIVNVTATTASSKAMTETVGVNIGYSISKAKVFKYINGVKKPVSATQIKLGDEVVMKGTKTGSTFKVDTLVINNRDFEVIGKVQEVHTDLKTIVVLVAHSNYREAGIKGKEITFQYSDSTVCRRLGSVVDCSTIPENNQIVKLVGGVTGTDQVYELSKVYDTYRK